MLTYLVHETINIVKPAAASSLAEKICQFVTRVFTCKFMGGMGMVEVLACLLEGLPPVLSLSTSFLEVSLQYPGCSLLFLRGQGHAAALMCPHSN